ncbi:hypothetical protein CCHOA_06760 [Corynebacterium choanae]|uniref:Uncharacterized protein n=1 Tax=Corynebacterium choanae TaxID=1862358 RepID=A0A3G6JC60_9CORY|nr:hypothetical protein CCHOA_06760 [Corynebacterium choanae]
MPLETFRWQSGSKSTATALASIFFTPTGTLLLRHHYRDAAPLRTGWGVFLKPAGAARKRQLCPALLQCHRPFPH